MAIKVASFSLDSEIIEIMDTHITNSGRKNKSLFVENAIKAALVKAGHKNPILKK